MGASLARSVEQYNRFVGTLESRVLVTARRMHELDLVSEDAPALEPITATPRPLSAPELLIPSSIDRRDDEFLEGERSGPPPGDRLETG